MACDHLDKRTFENSMDVIKDSYDNMVKIFNTKMDDTFRQFYTAWQSPRGYDRLNGLYAHLKDVLDTVGTYLVRNYNIMKEGAEAYGKAEGLGIFGGSGISVESISKQTLNIETKTFSEGDVIVVEDEKIDKCITLLENNKTALETEIKEMLNVASSDSTFGYYSTGTNPRQALEDALRELDSAVEAKFDVFKKNIKNEMDADVAERDAAKNQSLVDKIASL